MVFIPQTDIDEGCAETEERVQAVLCSENMRDLGEQTCGQAGIRLHLGATVTVWKNQVPV